ncbi:MAG: M28 family peptidase [Bacteroidetes bacterium]|nr:M28 family peptidase [Bacteroidota bacterium]
MIERRILILIIISCFCLEITGQNKQARKEEATIKMFKQHIEILASDRFEGRETGELGEKLAYQYIIGQFEGIGLEKQNSEDGYLQPFTFGAGKEYGPGNKFTAGRRYFKLNTDFYPLVYSSNSIAKAKIVDVGYGIEAPELDYDDYEISPPVIVEDYIFMIATGSPEGNHPHTSFGKHVDLRYKVETAIAHGAVGVIFYNVEEDDSPPDQGLSKNLIPSEIPVIYAHHAIVANLKLQLGEIAMIQVELLKVEKTGYNVVAALKAKPSMIDTGNHINIVIGAHYDHLGYGSHNSLYRGDPQIHNGADDNASGVAGLIELARLLKDTPFRHRLKFAAFVNEEPPFFQTDQMGSFVYIQKTKLLGENIKTAIILEMLGYYSEKPFSQKYPLLLGPFYPNKANFIAIVGNFPSKGIVKSLTKGFRQSSKFPVVRLVSPEFIPGVNFSDHWSFWQVGIPAVMVTDTAYLRSQYYHQKTDLLDTLDYQKMAKVVFGLKEAIIKLDKELSD